MNCWRTSSCRSGWKPGSAIRKTQDRSSILSQPLLCRRPGLTLRGVGVPPESGPTTAWSSHGCWGRNGKGSLLPAHHAPRGVRILPTLTIRRKKPFCQSLPIQHGNLTAPAGSNGSSSWLLRAVTHSSAERHEQNVSRTNTGLFVSSSSCVREWGALPKESDRGCQASGTPISLQAFLTPYRVELGSGLLYRVFTDGTGLRCGRSP